MAEFKISHYEYITTRTAFTWQIFRTTGESRIHIVAVAPSVEDLKYLAHMIQKKCGDDLDHISAHGVREVIKDVYGGVGNERKDHKNSK